MKKKILTLLVLLMTAVTGAVAQYESHWPDFNKQDYADANSIVAAIKIDDVIITADDPRWDALEVAFFVGDECRGSGTGDNSADYYLYNGYVVDYGDPFPIIDGAAICYNTAGETVSVKMYDHINGILYEDCVVTLQGEPLTIHTGEDHMEGWDDPENPVILSFTTPESEPAESSVTVTEITKNQWQFLMPAFDVELEVEYDTELALNEVDDNAAKLDEWNGYEADVTLTRTLAAGVWNTLAAPFGISATNYATLQQLLSEQGGTIAVKELTSTTLSGQTLTLNFTDATQIEAGKPYLVKVSKELNLATLPAQIDALSSPINPFKGVIISKTAVPVETSYVNFIPTLGKTLVTGPTGDEDNEDAVLFLAAGNTLKNPTVVNDPEQQSSYLKGFRAYFQLKDASNARSITLNLGDESTGITTTDFTDSTDKAGAVYDLQGRKVNAAQKGVYIQNGKKTVVK